MDRKSVAALLCLLAVFGSANAQAEFPTVADAATNIGSGLIDLSAAIVAAGLLPAVEDSSTPLTLFAPTNQALAALATEFNVTLAELLQSEALPTVLEYHLVSGLFPASALSDGMIVPTLEGGNLTISITGTTVDVVSYGSTATVTYPDYAEVPNKLLIHVIDAVLVPEVMGLTEVVLTEVPVPAPLLDEALLLAAEATLTPVVAPAPATSSSRKLLSVS